MSRSTPKPLANWLIAPTEQQLGGVLSHVRLLRRLTAVLRDIVPAPLAEHCQAANLESGVLVIAVDSSAWAAKLRYHLAALLPQLKARGDLPVIDQVRLRIQPPRLDRPPRPAYRRPLSAATAALIAQVADHTTDAALREALHRLARHASEERSGTE